MQVRSSVWRRDPAYFIAGPALLTIVVSALFAVRPWPVPIPSQGALLQPVTVTVLLLAGLLGVILSSRAGYPSAPPASNGRAWGEILLAILLAVAGFGAALIGVGVATNFTSGAVKALGATWVNVPLPWSLLHYGAAAVLLGCAYRLLSLPSFGWLIGRLLEGRSEVTVFAALAVLTSCIEPASMLPWLGRARSRPSPR
jgi:hypothetical protein